MGLGVGVPNVEQDVESDKSKDAGAADEDGEIISASVGSSTGESDDGEGGGLGGAW